MTDWLDRRPLDCGYCGTQRCYAYIRRARLPFVNADVQAPAGGNGERLSRRTPVHRCCRTCDFRRPGGHDVPAGKLEERFPRTLANLVDAIRTLPLVRVYDNENLRNPYQVGCGL